MAISCLVFFSYLSPTCDDGIRLPPNVSMASHLNLHHHHNKLPRPSPTHDMSSLNSVVNKLVRAAASVSTEISDADLDVHVARILAEEAKANDNKWAELGLGAYLKREQGRDS